MKFHVWMPNMFGFKGGIQVYSAYFLQTLQKLRPHAQYDVFLKHDTEPLAHVSWLPQTRFHFAGRFPLRVRTPLFAAQLLSAGLRQRPDLIITTHLNFTPAAAQLKRWAGIPYWTIAHGVEAWKLQKPTLKTALSQADRILAGSPYTRDRLLAEQALDTEQVQLLSNTFDHHRFQIAPKPAYLLKRYNLRADQPVILTVNRLCRDEIYKGYDQVLNALPQIRQVLPDVRYIIVGKGDDRPRIEQFIQQLGLQETVILAGFVPDQELCNYYNLCDVFAMPSKLEGFGIVYLEALACGKPTLGGNQDGAIDALCHGQLGALVNPDDVGEIAQTLVQILQRTYPNPLLYQPHLLRQKVVQFYGLHRFEQILHYHLQQCSYSRWHRTAWDDI